MQEPDVRSKLRAWIQSHAKSQPESGLTDQTLILEEGVLSSLDIAEFVLYIESLRGEEVDVESLEPRVFANIDALYSSFFAGR